MIHRTPISIRRRTPLVLGVLFAVSFATAAAAEHRVEVSRQFDAAAGTVVVLENLAGTIEIEGGGGRIEIDAVIVGRDERTARELEIEFAERGSRLVVTANYPVERYDTYHYPGTGDGVAGGLARWFDRFSGNSNTRTEYQGRRVSVTSKPGGDAVTLYADFKLRLPAGVGARVENAVGPLRADGVDGPLSVDTGAGSVRVANGSGELDLDTGSGEVEIVDQRGAVSADTGSGDVRVARVVGDVVVDTGSGDVALEQVEGARIDVDTGSGSIALHGVAGEIRADTGSGGVEGRDLRARGRLDVDTGSGGVRLAGDFAAVESISISTGSGGVTLEASGMPAAEFAITTGSGGIDVDLPGLQVERRDRHELRASTGGGVPVRIETGSGGVTIRQR